MPMSNAALARQADPLRAYVTALLEHQHLSQPAAAKLAGVKPRTFIAWHNGETEKIDYRTIRSIVRALGGLVDHLDQVVDMTAEQARGVAMNWVSLSDEEKEQIRVGGQKLSRIVTLAADDPATLEVVLRRVRDAGRADPETLTLITGFLAGLQSSRPR